MGDVLVLGLVLLSMAVVVPAVFCFGKVIGRAEQVVKNHDQVLWVGRWLWGRSTAAEKERLILVCTVMMGLPEAAQPRVASLLAEGEVVNGRK